MNAESVENLAALLTFLDHVTAGTWLLAASLVVLILLAVAALHIHDQIVDRRLQALEVEVRDIHPPLRADQLLRDVLGDEADRMTETWDHREGRNR